MSLRISSLALAALLAACGSASPEPEGEAIECAIGPGAEFSAVCTLEIVSEGEIVIHHPDGGFRRFTRSADTPLELVPADGADLMVSQTPSAGFLGAEGVDALVKYRVDDARYRFDPGLIDPRFDD